MNWYWDSIFLFTLLHTSEGFCIAKPLSLLTARTKLLLHHHRRRIFLFFLSASFYLVLVIFMEWGVNNFLPASVSSAIYTTFWVLVPGLIISHDQNDMLSLWCPNALLTQAGRRFFSDLLLVKRKRSKETFLKWCVLPKR